MHKVPDQPAALDPVIEPRQRITVCAMLAAVDWIEAVHPYDGRCWFGLTAVGRSAYRRHLRAPQRPSRVSNAQPLVAADEIPNQ
jgi:hypothetical protein